MALAQKLKNITNQVADSTTDSIEINRLNKRIREETTLMSADFIAVGKFYRDKYLNGEAIEEEVVKYMTYIAEHEKKIAEYEEQIQMLKDVDLKIIK